MKFFIFLISILIIHIVVACDSYTTNELISYGDNTRKKYSVELKSLIKIADSVAIEPCAIYQISTSKKTDYFAFEEYVYDKDYDKVVSDKIIKYNKQLEQEVWEVMPYEEITNFSFIKNVYVEFVLEFYRDKKLNNAALIYCIDKEKFFKLFPNYTIYDKKSINNLKNISENWMYFYDDNWAITTSSTVYKMTKAECNQLLTE